MEIHAISKGAGWIHKPFLLPVEKKIMELHQEGKAPADIAKTLNISIHLVQTKLDEFAQKQPLMNK
jgi:DNA-binding CsgD family transcriptional regulator